MNHHLKRIMLYTKRTLLGAMVAILIVFKAIDLGGAITGEVTAEQPATHLSAAGRNPDNCGFPSGRGGMHEENTRSSGF
ncbi:hypothetical protein ACM7LV_20160 [Pseudomonas aeruginosa]